MANNYIQPGGILNHTLTAAASSGDVVVKGSIAGIAQIDGAIGDVVPIAVEGVYEVPAATAAITDGAKVYWDADGDPVGGTAGSGAATATATDNTLIGYAIAAKASAGATVQVKLDR